MRVQAAERTPTRRHRGPGKQRHRTTRTTGGAPSLDAWPGTFEEIVVAMQLMVRAGTGLFDVVTAYDETYARYSPGIQLVIGAIDRFHEATDAQ